MEERMLLKTLRKDGSPMTVRQLVAIWEPTWNEEHIQSMLNRLVAAGQVTRQNGFVVRFAATTVES